MKDGVVVEQRGQFSNTTNVAGKTVTLEKTTRNKRVFKFKRISPKDVKQYERQGWKFSHAYGNNGGNGGGNGSSANRSLLRGLTTGKFITFMYRGKPVFGQIDKIDTRTGEVHMKKNPQGMYNQNLLGIQIPTPGSEAEIKFRPSANSQITRLRDTLPKAYRDSLQKRGFQNLSVGFKLSNLNAKEETNYLTRQVLGSNLNTKFTQLNDALDVIRDLPEDQKENALQQFVFVTFNQIKALKTMAKTGSLKPQMQTALTSQINKLENRIRTIFFKDNPEGYQALMSRAEGILAEAGSGSGWTLTGVLTALAGHTLRFGSKVVSYMKKPTALA